MWLEHHQPEHLAVSDVQSLHCAFSNCRSCCNADKDVSARTFFFPLAILTNCGSSHIWGRSHAPPRFVIDRGKAIVCLNEANRENRTIGKNVRVCDSVRRRCRGVPIRGVAHFKVLCKQIDWLPTGPTAEMKVEAEVVEGATDESETYFFYRLGEICFTPASQLSEDKNSRLASKVSVAVAPHHGWTVFADQKGMIKMLYTCESNFLSLSEDCYAYCLLILSAGMCTSFTHCCWEKFKARLTSLLVGWTGSVAQHNFRDEERHKEVLMVLAILLHQM